MFSQHFDGIAAIPQDAAVSIDEGNAATARGRIHEGRIIGHQAEVIRTGLDLSQVHGPNRAIFNGESVSLLGAIVSDGDGALRHVKSSLTATSGPKARPTPPAICECPSQARQCGLSLLRLTNKRRCRPAAGLVAETTWGPSAAYSSKIDYTFPDHTDCFLLTCAAKHSHLHAELLHSCTSYCRYTRTPICYSGSSEPLRISQTEAPQEPLSFALART